MTPGPYPVPMHPLAREMHWVDTSIRGARIEEEVVAHHSPFTQASFAKQRVFTYQHPQPILWGEGFWLSRVLNYPPGNSPSQKQRANPQLQLYCLATSPSHTPASAQVLQVNPLWCTHGDHHWRSVPAMEPPGTVW